MRTRGGPGRGCRGDAGSVSLELVLLVPVLVLLTLFVLWAGRGGRAGLTADLAAEEAATAAALCCDEGVGGEADREALAADVLRARPGLEFLCVGGLRPDASSAGGGGPGFVSEHWLDFDPDPAVRTGGVGVLGVRFLCESDGAVAPLRGLFPTVTFHGQASEVVVREPPAPNVGFEELSVSVGEDEATLDFVVELAYPILDDIYVQYRLDPANPPDAGLMHALPASDSSPPLQTVLIRAGGDEATISIALTEVDNLFEGTERLVLELQNLLDASGNTLTGLTPPVVELDPSRSTATGEVTDDDPQPYLFLSPAASCQVTEGGTATFNVRLRNRANTANARSATRVTVDVRTDARTGDGIATAGTDYTAVVATTVTFTPGDVVGTPAVDVTILDDDPNASPPGVPEGEPTETFHVVLENEAGADLGTDDPATCEILDDEAKVSVADVSADEGGDVTFTVSLNPAPQADVVIGYAFHNDALAATTATWGAACTAGVDYVLPAGVAVPPAGVEYTGVVNLPVSAGSVSAAIPAVTTCDDSIAEPDERFWLDLSVVSTSEAVLKGRDPARPARPPFGGWATITDNDTLAISVDDASAAEGETLEFEVGLEVGGDPTTLLTPVTLDYAVKEASPSVSAVEGTDYTAAPGQPLEGSLTFQNDTCSEDPETHTTQTDCENANGDWIAAEQTLQVALLADYDVEGDETFVLELSDTADSTHGLEIADTEATGTIEDDLPPEVSVRRLVGREGSTPSFIISLDDPPRSGDIVKVDYAIEAAGTCTVEGHDTLGECQLARGNWRDAATEGADYDAPGTCTVDGHDTRSECQDASGIWEVPIPLSGTLAFESGETTMTVPVDLLADYLVEGDETFRITLSGPDKAILDPGASTATGTITDDPPPQLSVERFTGPEDSTQSFTVRLRNPRGDTVKVDYAIGAVEPCTVSSGSGSRSECELADGTWRPPATAGVDYAAAGTCAVDGHQDPAHQDQAACTGATPTAGVWTVTTPLSGTLEFESGETVPVRLLADTVREDDETFGIVLSNPDNAILDPGAFAATGTITNVDPTKLTVNDPSAKEGETLVFVVTLEAAEPGQSVDVDYQVQNRSAKAGRDFTAIDPLTGTLTLHNTSTTDTVNVTAPVRVQALSDTIVENDKTLHLVLSPGEPNIGSVGLAKSIGVGTIENVNPTSVRVNDAAVVEGGELGFVVSLTDDAGDPAVISQLVPVYYYAPPYEEQIDDGGADDTDDGGAKHGTNCSQDDVDYRQVSGGVFFVPSDSDPIAAPVRTCTDLRHEGDETLQMELALPLDSTNASLADGIGIGTIVDAAPLALRMEDDFSAFAGDQLIFYVRLGKRDISGVFNATPAGRVVEVTVTTEDLTATAGADYIAASRRLTFGPNDAIKTFRVDTIIDDEGGPPETMQAVLSGARNALIERAAGIGVIFPRCVDRNAEATDPDNQPPTITFHDFSGEEGAQAVYRASLSRPVCGDASWIDYWMESDTAECGVDSGCSGTIDARFTREFAWPYAPFTLVSFDGWDDTLDEDDERIRLCMNWGARMPRHYQSEPDVCGYYTIIDNDDEPSLRVAEASADEGDTMTFTVSLDAASGKTVTVAYSTIDGSGTAESADYTAASGTLTFTPGDTSRTFTVVTATDADTEDDTFLVELSAPMNARIDDGTAVGTILEGDLPELRIADARGDEDSNMTFTVTLSEAATTPVTVRYATVERPQSVWAATEGADYTAPGSCSVGPHQDEASCIGATPTPGVWTPGGTLNFAIGDRTRTISVPIADDEVDEVDETFLVELSNPSDASLADPSAVGTINGSVTCVDATEPGAVPPVLTIDFSSAYEDAGAMVFTATLDQPFCDRRELSAFVHAASTATVNRDFRRPGSAYFDALSRTASFSVEIIDNDIAEQLETIRLVFRTSGRGVNISNVLALGAIFDDDTASLSLEASSVDEGDVVNFVVRLDRPAEFDVTVDYATADGTATSGSDYAAASDTATIRGTGSLYETELSVTVPVATVQDSIGEDDETFELRLSNPIAGVQLPDAEATAVVTIRDDDLPGVRISDASANEGGTLTFTVTLDTLRAAATTIEYKTRDGTATGDEDYTTADSEVTIGAGERSATISVAALTDGVLEADERFFVDLASSSSYDLDDGVGVGVIRDVNDRTLTVSDASAVEGGTLNFEVGFNDPPGGRDITVRYRTVAGTAAAGDDYSANFESAAGTLTILAGDTSATASVPTVQDTLDEDAEALELVLSDPVGGVLGTSRASGVIIDDDPEPVVSVSNAEATENGDGTPIAFTLSLSEPSGRDVTVPYSTADVTGEDAATAGSDYVAAASNAAETIAAGDTTATIDVALLDDSDQEAVERFLLNLSDPTNAGRGDGIGVGTIYDDDGLQILADDAPAVHEGEGASAVFTVRLSEAAADDVTVKYSTEDATATAGEDYTAVASPLPTLTFAAGEESFKTVSVALLNDDIEESTEIFRLKLSDPSANARIGDGTAVATIIDDDSLPELSVGDASATEGASASFTVSLSEPSPRDVTVDYAAVADPTAGDAAAVPVQDFDAVSGTLTIAARSRTATVTVTLPDDSLDEHNETFWLRLRDPSGATIVDGTGVGTIADNDLLPRLSIANGSATEGDTVGLTVQLEPVSGRTVTVPWTTAATTSGNPATAGEDYTTASGTLTFVSGTTSARIEVTTLQDETSEPDETFQVSLGQPTHATLADAVAVGAIRDDDGLPRISIADAEVSEDDSPATFTVTLSRTSNEAVTVDYATSDGTATAGDDYATSTGAQGTLTIPAGLRRGEISVFVADDDEAEEAETFHITLSNPVNAVIAEDEGTATATIRDDDSVTVSIANAEASEGDGTIDFTVTLSQAHSQTVTVDYTTFDGSAVQTLDYAAASGTVTIAAGNSTAAVSVTLTDDTHAEDDESFQVRLSNPRGDAFLETAEAVGTIIDDDQLPRLSPSRNLVVDEDAGSVTVEVTMDRVFDREVSVDYYSFWSWGGMRSSQTSCPWVHASGTLVFEPGATSATIPVSVFSDPGTCRIRGSVSGSARFAVAFLNPVNAVLEEYQADITVRDSIRVPGAPQTVRLNMHRTWGATEGVGNAQVPLRLSAPHSQAVQVGYTIRALTATAGVDYVHSGGSLTIPANQQEATLQIAIVDDTEVEQTESFVIEVTSVTNAKWVSGGTGTAFSIHDNDTDNDNDAGISVSGPTAVGEGSGTVRFSVYFPASITETVTVDYSTVDGTAKSPGDYTAVSSTLTYTPPESPSPFFWGEWQSVEVPLIDDDTVETNETFSLVLSNAVGASIRESEAEVTIISDDGRALPLISLADGSFYEADEIAWLTYTLSEESAETVTVEFRFVEAPELGVYAAEDSSDYSNTRWDTYTVRVPAGQTSGIVFVKPIDDAIDEHDERFKVELYDPVNAELGTAEAWATILDDDDPIVSIADQTFSEGAAAVVFGLVLDKPGIVASSVDYTTAPISSRDSAAIPDQDYTHTSGTARFAAGSTTATITVPIISDDTDEPDEMFQLRLSNHQRLRIDDAVGVGTIVDDDPGWIIDDQSVREDPVSQGRGEDEDPVMVFNVERDHTSTEAVTLNYRIAAAGSAMGGDDCDTAGVDFITPSGSVTLQAADTTATITITLCDDDEVEGRETLLIELTGVPGRKLTGTGTITSDDR
ncbi:MAG: hypothetical protein F4216_12300 [Acidimicrobiaceae bacterium]|nr:hypothetical protein [Acidimicrobiaceae bacterium]